MLVLTKEPYLELYNKKILIRSRLSETLKPHIYTHFPLDGLVSFTHMLKKTVKGKKLKREEWTDGKDARCERYINFGL